MLRQSLLLIVGLVLVSALAYPFSAKGQDALQQSQAKAMREAMPPEAKCEFADDGTPTCDLGDYRSGVRLSGFSPSHYQEIGLSSGLISFNETAHALQYAQFAQAIIVKYLVAIYGLDEASIIRCFTEAQRQPQYSGVGQVGNGKYVLSCDYIPGNQETFYVSQPSKKF